MGGVIQKLTAALSPPQVRDAINNPSGIFPKTNVATGPDPTKNLNRVSAVGNQQLKAFETGHLRPGEQAVIDAYKKSAGASLNQEMGAAGLSKSTAAAMGKGAVDAQAAQMAEQFLQQDFSNAMDSLGMTTNAYYTATQQEMMQNSGVMSALGGVAEGIGALFA